MTPRLVTLGDFLDDKCLSLITFPPPHCWHEQDELCVALTNLVCGDYKLVYVRNIDFVILVGGVILLSLENIVCGIVQVYSS